MTEKKPSVSSSTCENGSHQAQETAFCGQTVGFALSSSVHMTEVLDAGSRDGFLGVESKPFTEFLLLRRP
jgi:hypothetical protein